MMLININRTD